MAAEWGPILQVSSSLYGKKEGEKAEVGGGGGERVGERKRIKYSVRKIFH